MSRAQQLLLIGSVSMIAFSLLAFLVITASPLAREIDHGFAHLALVQNDVTLTFGIILFTSAVNSVVATLLVMLIALDLLRRGMRKEMVFFMLSMIFTLAGTILFKSIFAVSRPEGGILELSSFSFPSAHAALTLAFAISLVYALHGFGKTRSIAAKTGSAALIILALLTGLSRVYLGVHRTSDIVGGFLLAIAVVALLAGLVEIRVRAGKTTRSLARGRRAKARA